MAIACAVPGCREKGDDTEGANVTTDEGTGAAAAIPVESSSKPPEDTLIPEADTETSTRHAISANGHAAPVVSLAYSADGTRLLSGSEDGTAIVWGVGAQKELRRLPLDGGAVGGVAFHPDGQAVAVGSKLETLAVWDAEQGRVLREGRVGWWRFAVDALAYSPDGEELAVVAGNLSRYRKLTEPGETTRITLRDDKWHENRVEESEALDLDQGTTRASVAYSSDGRLLAVGESSQVRVFEHDSGELLAELQVGGDGGSSCAERSVAFSPDAGFVAAAGDECFRLWNLESRAEVDVDEAGFDDGYAVGFDHQSSRFLVLGEDQLAVFALPEGKREKVIELEDVGVNTMAVSPSSSQVAYPNKRAGVTIRDIESGEVVGVLDGESRELRDVEVSADGRALVTLHGESEIQYWPLAEFEPRIRLDARCDEVGALTLSRDGTQIAAGCKDGAIWLWLKGADGSFDTRRLGRHDGEIAAVEFGPDGERMMSADRDGEMRVWSVKEGAVSRRWQHRELESHDGEVVAAGVELADLSGDGRVVVASSGGGIRFYDIASEDEPKPPVLHSAGPFFREHAVALAAAPDGHRAVFTTHTGRQGIYFFDEHQTSVDDWQPAGPVAPDTPPASFEDCEGDEPWQLSVGPATHRSEETSEATFAAISPDDRQHVFATREGEVRLYANESMSVPPSAVEFETPARPIADIAYAAGGRYLVVAGENGTLQMVDAETCASLQIVGHGTGWAGWMDDGSFVTVGSDAPEVHMVEELEVFPEERRSRFERSAVIQKRSGFAQNGSRERPE